MAEIRFYAGNNFEINDLAGSGLGFFSSGFGHTVSVGSWQDRTYITNANGTAQGAEANNIKYLNSASGILGQAGSGIALTAIPNYQSTLNIRFTHTSAVQVTAATLRIYDRGNINNAASGVTTAVAEIIHPDIVQNNNGSGSEEWVFPQGSSITLSLAPSPGPSGLFAGNGSNSTYSSNRHDHYICLSASPDSIGSKSMYALFVQAEYL